MITVEMVVRDYLTIIYFRNNYNIELDYILETKPDWINYCANDNEFWCFIAVNSSTILGIVVSIS
jgi:hypothetical protein